MTQLPISSNVTMSRNQKNSLAHWVLEFGACLTFEVCNLEFKFKAGK